MASIRHHYKGRFSLNTYFSEVVFQLFLKFGSICFLEMEFLLDHTSNDAEYQRRSRHDFYSRENHCTSTSGLGRRGMRLGRHGGPVDGLLEIPLGVGHEGRTRKTQLVELAVDVRSDTLILISVTKGLKVEQMMAA